MGRVWDFRISYWRIWGKQYLHITHKRQKQTNSHSPLPSWKGKNLFRNKQDIKFGGVLTITIEYHIKFYSCQPRKGFRLTPIWAYALYTINYTLFISTCIATLLPFTQLYFFCNSSSRCSGQGSMQAIQILPGQLSHPMSSWNLICAPGCCHAWRGLLPVTGTLVLQ